MGIFNNNLEIDIENPFKHDKLQREEEVRNLTTLFDVVDNQMVLAVNSKWGTGKTSFLQMWNQYLKNEGYKTIFFNAWENDYVEEPFIAFVDEIREIINDENKIRGLMEKAKDVSLALFKQTPKMASKILKEKTGFDSEEIISNDELAKSVADKIDNYNKNKKSVAKFRKELENISLKEFEQNTKPMIIFVDELDRCRPDYAINLLERVKHFFNVQNIIFILGIDKEALSNSIRVIYGEQTDINGYLTRFIDLEYRLKTANNKQYLSYLMNNKYKFSEIFSYRKPDNILSAEYKYCDFAGVVMQVIITLDLPLRDIEKIIVEIYMILRANIHNYIYPYLLIILCVIKKVNREIYNQIKSKQIDYNELLLKLKKQNENFHKCLEDKETLIYKAYLIWLIDDNAEIERIKEGVERVEEDKRWKDNGNRLVECYESIVSGEDYKGTWVRGMGVREKIFKMIDLYDSLNFINVE
jgi:KAP family P-loop domain.